MSGAHPLPYPPAPPRRQLDRTVAEPERSAAEASFGAELAALERCVVRLEEVVDHETAALKGRAAVDLREFTNRKSQGLLDLTRCLRQFQGAAPGPIAAARLAGLRAKLAVNQAVLKLHLDAVREVATVMTDAIRDAESDGTYSPSVCGVVRAYD